LRITNNQQFGEDAGNFGRRGGCPGGVLVYGHGFDGASRGRTVVGDSYAEHDTDVARDGGCDNRCGRDSQGRHVDGDQDNAATRTGQDHVSRAEADPDSCDARVNVCGECVEQCPTPQPNG
jgi:hypothetical protein